MELLKHLQARQSLNNPIRVGLVGCGQMGSGMVHITHKMPGMVTQVIADINPDRALKELTALGIDCSDILVTNSRGKAADAIQSGKYVVCEDSLLPATLDQLDVVVEATGLTEIGAQVAWTCIQHQKHIVMLNVETDVTVGLFLKQMAEKVGCVYTVAAGDEPAVCNMLYEFASSLGFEVTCLGKGKNNVIDFSATPDSCREEALSKNMNPHMLAAFKDGTKTMVEMAAVCNATGLIPDVPGMHGPKVEVNDLVKVFVPMEDGGILTRRGCVEYSTGAIAPGVFAIVTSDDKRIRDDMRFVSMGNGPYYLFLRPYHLCSIETPLAMAEAVLYGESVVAPRTMNAEVVAVAKRELCPGETIGGIGSADIYNRICAYTDAQAVKGIPMGIAQGGMVLQRIPKGSMLTEDNFQPDNSLFVYKLRQMQNAMLEQERNGRA
jgi:predicted homoserine dehydrogenase-like protein